VVAQRDNAKLSPRWCLQPLKTAKIRRNVEMSSCYSRNLILQFRKLFWLTAVRVEKWKRVLKTPA